MEVIDLFAGAGGWEAGGIDALGIELDSAACATRKAAGLATLQANVASLEPSMFGHVGGLVASPPCQTFSLAGSGAGRRALDQVLDGIAAVIGGHRIDWADDPRTGLVLEPLRWALELEPDWIALEQVPPVLPVWEAVAHALRADGYFAVTGCLNAEQYGVPQSRKRAVLLAARWPVELPTPTHSRYHLRTPARLDRGVLPWVSMSDALGPGSEVRQLASGTRSNSVRRYRGEPAPTLAFGHDVASYVWLDDSQDVVEAKNDGAVRLSIEEASVLQSFPEHSPWRGTLRQQYQQIGNAIPPLLARAVLAAARATELEAAA